MVSLKYFTMQPNSQNSDCYYATISGCSNVELQRILDLPDVVVMSAKQEDNHGNKYEVSIEMSPKSKILELILMHMLDNAEVVIKELT